MLRSKIGRRSEWDDAAAFAERYIADDTRRTYRQALEAFRVAYPSAVIPGDSEGLKAAIHYRRKLRKPK